jgi:hypothetical protein
VSQVYELNGDVRVRKEGTRFLCVNMATQGLHFITPTAYSLVSRLDGKVPALDIAHDLWPKSTEREKKAILQFLDALVERKIVRVIR